MRVLFYLVFDCYVSDARSFFWCLNVTLVMNALFFWCLIVTLVMRALFVLVFDCYVSDARSFLFGL